MNEVYDRIKATARDLSQLIKKNGITLNYEKSIRELKNDSKSREILEKLVRYGRELEDKQVKGRELRLDPSQEVEMTRKELEENSLVKSYLMHQKEYLNMLNAVMKRIKNPSDPGGS